MLRIASDKQRLFPAMRFLKEHYEIFSLGLAAVTLAALGLFYGLADFGVEQPAISTMPEPFVASSVTALTALRTAGVGIDVLAGLVADAIRQLPWPKSMRFAHQSFRWVRPLHSVLAVFDGAALDGSLDLGGGDAIAFGDRTRGHRFLAPEPFSVTGFDDYAAKLRAAEGSSRTRSGRPGIGP